VKKKQKKKIIFFFFFFVIKKFSFFLDSHALHAAVAKVLQDQTLARCGPKVEQAAAAVDSPAHRQHRSVRLSLSLSPFHLSLRGSFDLRFFLVVCSYNAKRRHWRRTKLGI